MRYQKLYAVIGSLLGLGCPLGALLGRAVWNHRDYWAGWISQEWGPYGYFYLYMGVGSILVFSLFGFTLGKRADALRNETLSTADTFDTLNLLAITDGLTGLYNHRYLQERVAMEIESANRYHAPVTGLMADLDDFKSINDRYGHPFGDLVLVTVSRIIRENLRRIDVAGRYGGEEFMVLMPHTHVELARSIAERIRRAVEEYRFALKEEEVKVTLSIGIATYPMPEARVHDKSSFLKAMDQALYRAKWHGKNQIVVRQAVPAADPATS